MDTKVTTDNTAIPVPPASAPTRRPGLSGRELMLGALLLLLGGTVGGMWLASRYLIPTPREVVDAAGAGGDGPQASPESGTSLDRATVPTVSSDAAGGEGAGAGDVALALTDSTRLVTAEGLAARVTGLEDRLARIALAAESASGNAARAEGLLIAFAARRALDRGMPLGYLEAQLRLRFGDAQPNAVRQIVETARAPVMLDALQTQLDALTPQLLGQVAIDGDGLLAGLRREVSELFIFRPAGAASTRAADRLARAKRLLDAGLADQAITEVEALPGASMAAQWLIDARRYNEARRALDVIETAAILEPRDRAATDIQR